MNYLVLYTTVNTTSNKISKGFFKSIQHLIQYVRKHDKV